MRHHLAPVESLERYAARLESLPSVGRVLELAASGSRLEPVFLSDARQAGFIERDTWVARHAELRAQIAAANELAPIELSDAEVADLLAFLRSLTDPRARELEGLVPQRVPSGLRSPTEEIGRRRGGPRRRLRWRPRRAPALRRGCPTAARRRRRRDSPSAP